ncbi:hypothetical protein TI01_0227 [Lysobacter sp. A03]|nr:hypothetical protein TI01_0227 [Lysobacter sp. A03]
MVEASQHSRMLPASPRLRPPSKVTLNRRYRVFSPVPHSRPRRDCMR